MEPERTLTLWGRTFTNGESIDAKVYLDIADDNGEKRSGVIIRKLVIEHGRIARKEALTPDGTWVVVPEGAEYPPETHLPIAGLHTQETEDELKAWRQGAYGHKGEE